MEPTDEERFKDAEHGEEDQSRYEEDEEQEDRHQEEDEGWNEEGDTHRAGWDEWEDEGGGAGDGDSGFHSLSWKLEGYFEEAKQEASTRDRWLIINLQSQGEFNSWLLDQQTWNSKTVSEILPDYFMLWQSYDDWEEGMKVRNFYKLDAVPAVLLIDPITGEKLWSKNGFIPPETLVEDLSGFMDRTPQQRIQALQRKTQEEPLAAVDCPPLPSEEPLAAAALDAVAYPPLPSEEPKRGCRIAIRLPSGLRRQRNFLETDPVQLLWSFCNSLLNEEEEVSGHDFELVIAVPGAVQYLDYETKLSFGESGWSNSVVSVKLLED